MVRDISRREMMNVCLNLLNEKEKLYFAAVQEQEVKLVACKEVTV